MRGCLVDPGRQKADKVQEDVRFLILLCRIFHGKKLSVISDVPGKYKSRIIDFHSHFFSVVFAWQHKNSPSHAGSSDSLFPPDHLFEVEFTLCCHNRQLILQVV